VIILTQAARQGHELIVDNLVEAGALLGGSDVAGGFVSLAVAKSAKQPTDSALLRTWLKAGANIDTKFTSNGGEGESSES
jgi:lysophospholipase